MGRASRRTVLLLLSPLVVVACAAPPSVVVVNSAPSTVMVPGEASTRTVSPSTRESPTARAAESSGSSDGDLGLGRAISAPACDGRYVVLVASVVAAPYPARVRSALDAHPGAGYVRTDQSCSSLRPATASGNPIYAVYEGPFGDLADACDRRAQLGGDAYVKVLDAGAPSSGQRSCTAGGG